MQVMRSRTFITLIIPRQLIFCRKLKMISLISSRSLSVQIDSVYNNIVKLQEMFLVPSITNSDNIVTIFQSLHDSKAFIPYSYFLDAIKIFAERNDASRGEHILHISKSNFNLHSNKDKVTSMPDTRSNPYHDPYQLLVSQAICTFFKVGNTDTALTLWIHMATEGYVTSRTSLEALLDSAAASRSIPPIEFIDKVHSIMSSNKWNHIPLYYVRIFKVLKQYFKKSDPTESAILMGFQRFMAVRQDLKRIISFHTTEIQALEVEIWILLYKMISNMTIESTSLQNPLQTTKSSHPKLLPSLDAAHDQAMTAFHNMIQAIQTHNEDKAVDLTPWIRSPFTNLVQGHAINPAATAIGGYPPSTTTSLLDATAALLHHIIHRDNRTSNIDGVIESVEDILTTLLNNTVVATSNSTFSSAVLTKVLRAAAEGTSNHSDNTDATIEPWVKCCKKIAAKRDIVLDIDFYCAWIEGLPMTAEATDSDIIHEAHRIMQSYFNRVTPTASVSTSRKDESTSDKNMASEQQQLQQQQQQQLLYSIVRLASRHRSLEVLQQLLALMELDEYKSLWLLKYWTSLLYAAKNGLKGVDRLRMVQNIERRGGTLASAAAAVDSSSNNNTIVEIQDDDNNNNSVVAQVTDKKEHLDWLIARMVTHAELRNSQKALELLLEIRQRNGRPDTYNYHSILRSLRQNSIEKSSTGFHSNGPKALCEWLLQCMLRDGLKPTVETYTLLLRLFSRPAKVAKDTNDSLEARAGTSAHEVLESALKFLNQIVDKGVVGHTPMPLHEKMVFEIIRACCVSGLEEKAFEILTNVQVNYNFKPTAICFEPIIYNYALVQDALVAAEDVLVLMTNQAVVPSTAIIDIFIKGYILKGDLVGALDRAQDFYNQFSVRPSENVILGLLDASLEAGDGYEARRAVVVVHQLFDELIEPGYCLHDDELKERFAYYGIEYT